MLIKQAIQVVPIELQRLEEATQRASKQRINWKTFGDINTEGLARVRGASETSRKIRVAAHPDLMQHHQRLWQAVPMAAAMVVQRMYNDEDQDRISLHPDRGTMRSADRWVYLKKGDDSGELSKAFSEIPFMNALFLRNLTVPPTDIKEWTKYMHRQHLEWAEDEKGLRVALAFLSAIDWSPLLEHSIFDKLSVSEPVRSIVGQYIRPLVRLYLPPPLFTATDLVAAWLSARVMTRSPSALSKAMGRAQGDDAAGLEEQIARRLSPMRAAFELLHANDKAFAQDAEAGYVLYTRCRMQKLASTAVEAVQPDEPEELLSLLEFEDLAGAQKLVQSMLEDSRFEVVKSGLDALGKDLKKHSGVFGKKERLKLGRFFAGYWQSLKYGEIHLAHYDPLESGRIAWAETNEHGDVPDASATYAFGWGGNPFEGGVEAEAFDDVPEETPYIEQKKSGTAATRSRQVQTGHMFIDMKDFTSKTAHFKELNMAEFMRWDFYDPLLREAKKYYQGMSQLDDRGGIFINNLMGDALSVCGEIKALVDYAHDARKVFGVFTGKLQEQAASDRARDSLERKRAALVAEANDLAGQYKLRLTQYKQSPSAELKKELSSIKIKHESCKKRIELVDLELQEIGDGKGAAIPEYGIYVSYGAEPVRVEFQDDVFGNLGVAISERINETARGTARSGGLREALMQGFAEARKANPELKEPAYQVLVGQEMVLDLPADQQARLTAAFKESRDNAASLLAQNPPDFILRDAIYNNGLALNHLALAAYLRTLDRSTMVRILEMDPISLAGAIEPYWTNDERPVYLFIDREQSTESGDAEGDIREGPAMILRYAGSLEFKGFEGKERSAVFEVITMIDPVYEKLALLEAEAKAWPSREAADWLETFAREVAQQV